MSKQPKIIWAHLCQIGDLSKGLKSAGYIPEHFTCAGLMLKPNDLVQIYDYRSAPTKLQAIVNGAEQECEKAEYAYDDETYDISGYGMRDASQETVAYVLRSTVALARAKQELVNFYRKPAVAMVSLRQRYNGSTYLVIKEPLTRREIPQHQLLGFQNPLIQSETGFSLLIAQGNQVKSIQF